MQFVLGYEISNIIDYRIVTNENNNNQKEIVNFLIEWTGHTEKSWEPFENLDHCIPLLSDFFLKIYQRSIFEYYNLMLKVNID
ncbi:hypothetical protein DERP_005374 [Dermatophagoides pteronyssinus]|uniref:Chromo domain-containing protein n=1 Tax=Dermatophagoides pteronyssinus TaxID=6956 RepID=A0ABQ8JMY6_DERPT|nr:hypothetical protein DERP_005374 [Dermatophagoides pteronyssinus]